MRFVLVHGSWHEGAHWAQVAAHLEALGHNALAPTMAGHGRMAGRAVNHAACVASITDFIVGENLEDIILVGHSFAGTVIAKVIEKIPERVRRMVFWNAFVPLNGHALIDEVPPHLATLFDGLQRSSQDGTVMLPYPIWRESFISDADEGLAKAAYETLNPEPFLPFTEKLDLTAFYGIATPRSFINCTEDMALPPGEWGWFPRMYQRLGLCRLVQMPGSHEALLTRPQHLAQSLIEAGRD